MLMPSFFFLLAGFGAITSGIFMLIFPSIGLELQLFIWLCSTSLYVGLWFAFVRPRQRDRTKAGLSLESIQGQVGLVLEQPEANKRGTLRFSVPVMGSDEWSFISDESIKTGDRVRVIDVSGNALIVEKHSS